MESSKQIRPGLSVIVCTYNRADRLVGCLMSLADQTIDKKSYEVIVVDNNSTDGTARIVTEISGRFPNFRMVKELRQGLSYSRNRGWREANGKYVAFIDDDAKATRNWCANILNAFETVSPRPAAVGGEVHPFYEVSPPRWFSDDLEIRSWGSEACFLQSPRAVYGFSGSNMAFTRNILENYKGFSPRYGMSGKRLRVGEETELFSRIHGDNPLFWYDPQIKVFHWVPKKNMSISYRFWRSFVGGKSFASIQRRQFFSIAYFKNCIGLLYFLLTVPISLLKSFNRMNQEAVMRLEEFGFRSGYLVGANVNNIEESREDIQ